MQRLSNFFALFARFGFIICTVPHDSPLNTRGEFAQIQAVFFVQMVENTSFLK